MSKYSIDSTTLTSIGNAIRSKEGSSALIPVSDFATRITNLPSGGGSSAMPFTDNVVFVGSAAQLYNERQNFSAGETKTFTYNYAKSIKPTYLQSVYNNLYKRNINDRVIQQCLFFLFLPKDDVYGEAAIPLPNQVSLNSIVGEDRSFSIVNSGNQSFDNGNNRIYYYFIQPTYNNISNPESGVDNYTVNIDVTNTDSDSHSYRMVIGCFNILKKTNFDYSNFEIIPTDSDTELITEIYTNPSVNKIFPFTPWLLKDNKAYSQTSRFTGIGTHEWVSVLRLSYGGLGAIRGSYDTSYIDGTSSSLLNSYLCYMYMNYYLPGLWTSADVNNMQKMRYPWDSGNNLLWKPNDTEARATMFYFNFDGVSNRRTRT